MTNRGPRDNAERTEVVAAVLDFQKCTSAFREIRNVHFLKYPGLHNIADSINRLTRLFNIMDEIHDFIAILVPDHKITPGISRISAGEVWA